MADPTEAEIRLMWGYAVLELEELRQLAESDATNLLGIEAEVVASVQGDFSSSILASQSAWRARVSDALSTGLARALLDPIILTYGKFINSPETDPVRIFRKDLYDYFVTNTLTIPERGFTFGSASAGGSNVGDGTVNRLNIDENGFDLDEQTAETKTLTCVQDEHSGTQEHNEQFDIRGQQRTKDFLTLKGGSGIPGTRPVGTVNALSGRDSRQFLSNPSFTTSNLAFAGGLATPTLVTDITGWTLDAVTNVQLDENITYRNSEGEATPRSLRFNANAYAQQNLNVRRAQVDETGINGLGQDLLPMYVQIAYYREDNADGDLTLTFGNVTATVDVSTVGSEQLVPELEQRGSAPQDRAQLEHDGKRPDR